MARMGEGDKRWIVEDRPDGTNVHNWHWSETDCLEWSRNFLSNLLCDKTLLSGEGNIFIKTKKLEKLEGEAYVNVRKGKIIPVPYISDENAGEDPEIRITIKDDGPIGKRLKEAFIAKGKPFVFEKIREYVDSMAKGGPAKDELEAKKVAAKKPAAGSPAASNSVANNSSSGAKEVKKKEDKKKEGFKTLTMSEKFSCRARDLYEILMDENRWKGFTQSNARISKEVGGEFSIFDGSVTGRNLELQEGKLIVQQWRFGSWPDGIVSTVRLTFDEPESGVTIVKLTHTDVPEEDRFDEKDISKVLSSENWPPWMFVQLFIQESGCGIVPAEISLSLEFLLQISISFSISLYG
ncbi:UNVERIFIED_CONTAM: Activator of heat shock protein ATPase [Sesamum calycinum]|uniref:Activator of heat shock protein ATPase n=1 Tax=Sesamum calycinum TaxID=2727403 RepID=A0AAW2RWI4_9LAMI